MATDDTPKLPPLSPFKTVLRHGARFKAVPAVPGPLYTHDILLDLPGGGHVASVAGFTTHGETCPDTEEHVAVLTASAQMLTALVDLLNARERGQSLPWGTVEEAVFAGSGAPPAGARFRVVLGGLFVSKAGPLHTCIAGTTWHVSGHGFDAARNVGVLLTSETEVEIALSLEELRHSFRPVTDRGG